MNDVDETCSLTSLESFRSALSRGEEEVSLISFAGDDEEQQEPFLLDIDELERVACSARGGVASRVRKTEKFERATYFLFRAEFVDGLAWDVIVPHSAQLQMQFRRVQDIKLPKVRPKLITWQIGSGMSYMFVKRFEHWEYTEWLQLAKGTEAQTAHQRSASAATSSSIPSILSSANESTPRTTEEMDRSELSRTSSRSRKSVRFDIEKPTTQTQLIKYDEVPTSLLTRLRRDTTRKIKRIKRILRIAKRKLDRPIIGFLMRCGY